ncbi:MAG: MFS transporter [Novosphingobium sp.]|nr:MFS transporter [Novosphingobium sp.]
MSDTQATAAAEWRAHWPMVFAAMVGMSFYSMFAYSQQMFIEPLEKQFHWPRAEFSLGYSIFGMCAFLFGPFVGAAIDRWGARPIAVPGVLLSALAFAALGFTGSSLWQWYGLWLVLALVGLGVKSTVWSVAVSGAFTASRGMALAIMLCGSALAQFFAPLVGNWLIHDYGWRQAYHLIGVGWGGLALVLTALFFFDAGRGRAKAAAQPTAALASLPGLTFRQSMRDPVILRIFAANLFSSLVGSGVTFHLKPIVVETGLTSTGAAEIAALAGIGGIVGKLLTGWLLDRVQGNAVPFFSYALTAVAYLLLLDTFHSHAAVAIGVLIIGYTSGAGLGLTAYLISRYAGMKAYGAVFGALGSMLMLGTVVGPPLAGKAHDLTGSYAALLIGAIPVVLGSALLMIGLGSYPEFPAAPFNTREEAEADAVLG